MLEFSRAIIHVNVELKTDVSEISSTSVFRADVVNDNLLLIYQFVRSMPLPIGVLCCKRAESNCAVTHPTLTFHIVT
jgi:hypothetical protein